MGAVHGKNAKLSYGGTDITSYINKTGLSQSADKADVTTLGKNSKNYIPGLLDGTLPIEGPFDPAVHAILAPLLNTQNAVIFQPNGVTVGQPKATCNAILESYEVASEIGGASTIKGTLQISGDVVWGVN